MRKGHLFCRAYGNTIVLVYENGPGKYVAEADRNNSVVFSKVFYSFKAALEYALSTVNPS